MMGQDPEMLQMFLEEAQEHLSGLEPDLLELEDTQDNPDSELINRIFRAVHSLKGSAGFFGFVAITELSHVMENLLSLVRDGKIKANSEMISSLLKGTDKLNLMVDDVENSESVEYADELEEINGFITGKPVEKKEKKSPNAPKTSKLDMFPPQFDVKLEDLKQVASHGHFLYTIKVFLRKDLSANDVGLDEYFSTLEKLGTIIASYTDISTIESLEECKDGEIAFVFLFSSVLEPDLVSVGTHVSQEQVTEYKLNKILADFEDDIEPKQDIVEELKAKPEPKKAKTAKKAKSVAAIEEDKKIAKTESAKKETLRVSVSLLNDLMTLAGELVLARNQLLRMASDVSKDVPGLPAVLQDINMTTTNLQGKIMDTRMQPIGLVFNKFPRLIRDLAGQMGKQIELELIGNDVELDKSIIENLSDPLTHLVRNSADHGLESTEERIENGKNKVGKIILKAYHESGKVNIEVTDDGGGINPAVILAKAIEKGVVTEADGAKLSDKDILSLIFAPGFSTAEKVTNVSGRGVGMDVVRTNIEKLGGSVSIESVLGKGTTLSLKLPLTLAIIPSLIITVEELNFAIPQIALKELVRIKTNGESQHKIEMVNNAPVLRLRNKLLPILYLKDVLELNKDKKSELDTLRILVLQHDDNEFGLVVDEIFDSEEIVVKSIPRFFKNSLCYSGTTIMGDGTVALILDIGGIAAKSNLVFRNAKEAGFEKMTEEHAKATTDHQNLLLFQNSPEEYFALNLDLIKRIEKITPADIELVGQKKYIEHEGKSLRIIDLHNYLPVKAVDNNKEVLYVIIPNSMEQPLGIIANTIIDAVKVDVKLDTDNISAKGLIGSTLINNKIVLFPDIYQLVELAEPEKGFKVQTNDNHKYNLLLVEDTPFFRTLAGQYLESEGFKLDYAIDGVDGLNKVKSKKYDLLIVDLMMPRMDGYEFVKNVRSNEETKEIPALALTTLSSADAKDKAFEVGFNEYEVKVNKAKLIHKIKTLLNIG